MHAINLMCKHNVRVFAIFIWLTWCRQGCIIAKRNSMIHKTLSIIFFCRLYAHFFHSIDTLFVKWFEYRTKGLILCLTFIHYHKLEQNCYDSRNACAYLYRRVLYRFVWTKGTLNTFWMNLIILPSSKCFSLVVYILCKLNIYSCIHHNSLHLPQAGCKKKRQKWEMRMQNNKYSRATTLPAKKNAQQIIFHKHSNIFVIYYCEMKNSCAKNKHRESVSFALDMAAFNDGCIRVSLAQNAYFIVATVQNGVSYNDLRVG